MPVQRLLPGQLMQITREVREYLYLMWKIPKSGITEVLNESVIADGHTYDDLAVITLEKMCEYIGSEESFGRAWELTCAKAYADLHPPIGMIKGAEQVVYNEDNIESVEDLKLDTKIKKNK